MCKNACLVFLGTADSTLWHHIVGEELREVLVPPNLHFSSKKNQKRSGEHEKLETEPRKVWKLS